MIQNKQHGTLFLVSAPSGAGKTTLVEAALLALTPHYPLKRVITYTTKKLTQVEKDRGDYYALSIAEFEQKIKEGFFIEWSTAYGTYYGSPVSIKNELEQGNSLILIIDRVGAYQVVPYIKEAVTIWITVSSIEELKKRLLLRGRESMDKIERRVARAEIEIKEEEKDRFYQYYIENNRFEDAIKALLLVIMKEAQLGTKIDQNKLLDACLEIEPKITLSQIQGKKSL